MDNQKLSLEYLDWLKSHVIQEDIYTQKYDKFFELLHDINFTYCIPMDQNREEDGFDLRYQFIKEHNYKEENAIALEKPCSMLEMMVALSIRMESTFAYDPHEYGDRTGMWFWNMVENLGLTGKITDEDFDATFIEKKISKCLERQYQSNGRGGLFIVPNIKEDLRDAEIWKQASWYMDTVLFEDEEDY